MGADVGEDEKGNWNGATVVGLGSEVAWGRAIGTARPLLIMPMLAPEVGRGGVPGGVSGGVEEGGEEVSERTSAAYMQRRCCGPSTTNLHTSVEACGS